MGSKLNLDIENRNQFLIREAVNLCEKAGIIKHEVIEFPVGIDGVVQISDLPIRLKEMHKILSKEAKNAREEIKKLGKKVSKGGNIGYAQVNIDGVNSEIRAFSSVNNLRSLRNPNPDYIDSFAKEKITEERQFDVMFLNSAQKNDYVRGWNRSVCAESKIMEEIARQLGNNRLAKGTINLFSEHSLCKSCELVIKQFKKKYPKVKIRVFTKAQYYNNL